MIKNLLSKCNKVFIYDNLKRGYKYHHLLQSSFIGEALTYKRFRLFVDGNHPIAIPVENGYRLKGELYAINDESILQALCWFEKYPLYRKIQIIKVEVPSIGKDFNAWIFYTRTPKGKEILPNENGIVEYT